MQVAIYGAGAMGTILGAYLSKAGISVDLINRNISHIQSLKKRGATVCGTVNFTTPVSALTPDEMTEKYDVIFLMTKQRQNEQTVTFLSYYLKDDGVICTTQNGLPEESVARIVGEDRCLGCAVSWGATFKGEGVAELTSSPEKLTFALGSIYGYNEKCELVKQLLEAMGKVTVEQNFIGARWAKLIINATFSSLSTLYNMSFGEVAKNKRTRTLAVKILNECIAVAKANNIVVQPIQGHNIARLFSYSNPFKRAFCYAILPLAMKNHKDLYSSMLFDIQKGKKSEIDFVAGKVIEWGNRANVATPTLIKVVNAIHELEKDFS